MFRYKQHIFEYSVIWIFFYMNTIQINLFNILWISSIQKKYYFLFFFLVLRIVLSNLFSKMGIKRSDCRIIIKKNCYWLSLSKNLSIDIKVYRLVKKTFKTYLEHLLKYMIKNVLAIHLKNYQKTVLNIYSNKKIFCSK